MEKGGKLARRQEQDLGMDLENEVGGLAKSEYEALRDRCVDILIEAEQNFLQSMWSLGQVVIEAVGEGRPEYGAQVVHRLAADLGVDHTHVYRAIQLYETYPKSKIFDTRSTIRALTWRKVRMLLPLPPSLRAEMEKRLASGELRTDEELRTAIYQRKVELGMVDMDYTPPAHLGVKGVDAEKARTLLRRVCKGDADLTFNLLTTWGDDYMRYYVRDGVPEEQRVQARRALAEHIRHMQRLYEGK